MEGDKTVNRCIRPPKGAVFCLMAGLAAFAFDASGQADTEASSQSRAYKIGIVDRKEVFDAYERTEIEYDKLEKEVEERQKVVDELSEKIEQQKSEYEKRKDTMTLEEREEFEAKVESDYRHYRSELERLQGDIDSMEMRVVKKLFDEIDQAIAEVGSEGNYHLVLDGGGEARGGVVYFSPTLDMTQKVIDHLNSKENPSADKG